MDSFEEKLKNILSEKIDLPNDYKYVVRNTLYEKNKRKHKQYRFVKIFAISCSCLILITSIVGAINISNYIQNFYNDNKGMDDAIKEGYIDEPNMEYVNSSKVEDIHAINTEIKIKNMLMDDHNLSFTFSIKLDENIDISKIKTINFPDMIITDENKAIIYCENKETFNRFCTNNNLQYEYLKFNDNYINNEVSYYLKVNSQKQHTIDVVYNLNTMVYSYPKSKKIYIDLKQINISESEKSDDIGTLINGDWKIDFDVSEKFYNRETLVYAVKSCSDEKINITEAYVTETGMVYEFVSKDEPIYSENDTKEVQREKILSFSDNEPTHVRNEYIENENGEIFKPIKGSQESSGTIYEVTGDFRHWQTFDLIKSKSTNKLTVHFNLNLHGYSRDVIIELERIQ